MNHYEKVAHEKMLQEQQRQQTASDEADDPWCRTLLPREGDKGKKGGAPFFDSSATSAPPPVCDANEPWRDPWPLR